MPLISKHLSTLKLLSITKPQASDCWDGTNHQRTRKTCAHSIHVVQLKVNGDETDVRKYAAHVALNADGNAQQERPQEERTVPAVSQLNPRKGSAVPCGTRGPIDFLDGSLLETL